MPCYYPRAAWRTPERGKNGKMGITFDPSKGLKTHPLTLPCGQCIGCRLERSRDWAIRLMHESQEHELSAFLTLTYSDLDLPKSGSLVPEHTTNFMKRLRFHHDQGNPGAKIKFFLCGEYGDTLGRPHYHAIIFGLDFADKRKAGKGSKGDQLYSSEKLESIWTHGKCWIGKVTPASANYVARYVLKKITGEKADDHYQGKKPEYIRMSKGIGLNYFHKYKESLYARDFVTIEGKEAPVPAYYDKQLEKENHQLLAKLKRKRASRALLDKENNTEHRLRIREEVQIRKIKHFSQRGL